MSGVLKPAQKGKAVGAFQEALNRRAEPRFYPPLAVDEDLGPATMRAFKDLGWALGLSEGTLNSSTISEAAQRIIDEPANRNADQLERARRRGPTLHKRTIGLDGAPIFWGLAKPLLRARERGWSGQLIAGDRRPGVPERFGKKSQATLFKCFTRSQELGRCPADCGGDCNPANPPGLSSHELRSDGSGGFPGQKAGSKLEWWQLGIDVGESDSLLSHLKDLGYKIHRTYPGKPKEFHHLNFTASPGRVLASTGPNAKPAKKPKIKATAKKKTGRLKGIDVSLNQPSVDWSTVADAGYAFAYAKVSDGIGTPDPKFTKERWSRMRSAGLARGAYHFGRPQPGRDPRKEVHEFLKLLDKAGGLKDGDLIPMLDMEAYGKKGKLSAKATHEWVGGFVEEMKVQIGRKPIIYTGAFWRDAMADPADAFDCRLWLAAYVKDPKPFIPKAWKHSGWTVWQHSETGKVKGVEKAPCDLNVMRGGTAVLEKLRM